MNTSEFSEKYEKYVEALTVIHGSGHESVSSLKKKKKRSRWVSSVRMKSSPESDSTVSDGHKAARITRLGLNMRSERNQFFYMKTSLWSSYTVHVHSQLFPGCGFCPIFFSPE